MSVCSFLCLNMLIKSLFFISLFFIFYTYAGYPLYLYAMTKLLPKPVKRKCSDPLPFVSVIIAAKNEALNIEKRINNLLQQDYPSDRVEIIVVSDGSDDNTQVIIQQLADRQDPDQERISCHAYFPSQGKPSALNIGVQQASGEIIVFADARQTFNKDVITELIKNFSDSTIGGVSGELVFLEEGESSIKAQMGAYWEYEKKIRKMESDTGSVVGATGAIYAIRKKLYKPLAPATLLDDVMTPMNIVSQGYRIVFDSKAIAYDAVSKNVSQEWNRKVRTLTGNWQLLSLKPDLLNPLKNNCWFRFLSHKFARILVPFFLAILFVVPLSQLHAPLYLVAFYGQVVLYLCALMAYFFPKVQQNSFLKFIYFFCVLNVACLAGFWRWATGQATKTWQNSSKG